LDLHPTPSQESDGDPNEKLEILEAGTGHGALTLYISRAIHGANHRSAQTPSTTESVEYEKHDCRNAIIHTLDVSEKYSLHARGVVKGFRHGLYYPSIDFHVADVSSWTKDQLTSRSNQPFLSHAILDLPNSDQHLEQVAKALRVDGTLVVFNPSITQITQCATKIREDGIPLELERVVELPTNGEAGGREWSVRSVRPRSSLKAEASIEHSGYSEAVEDVHESVTGDEKPEASVHPTEEGKDKGWQMVCRPKVGDRIIGGGFVGVWKKQRDTT
jgi:tRNA (adenine57-N1/adenine58-N1)-methyltransferase catalytic subunit